MEHCLKLEKENGGEDRRKFIPVSSSEIGLGQAIECMCMEGASGNISNTYTEMLATGFGNSLWI